MGERLQRRLGGIALAFLFAASSLVPAQSAPSPGKPRIIKFEERIDKRKVAGASLVGVIVGPLDERIVRPMIYVGGLNDRDRVLCLEFQRVDNGYFAKLVVGVAGAVKRGAVTINFPLTDKFSRIHGRTAAEVAVLARIGATPEDCENSSDIAPASWTVGASAPLTALILKGDRIATLVPPAGDDHPCRDIDRVAKFEGEPFSYTAACTLPKPVCGRRWTLSITRKTRRGVRADPIETPLRPSC